MNTIEIGHTYEVPYPFIRDTVSLPDDEGSATVESWVPGVKYEYRPDRSDANSMFASAMGAMLLTPVSTHKPGTYPERVFYTRRWRSPDGRKFGKTQLLVTTVTAFRTLLRGYRYPFDLRDAP